MADSFAIECPIKVFEIRGAADGRIKMEITEVFGYPDKTSFRGGYDVKCALKIESGRYSVYTDNYYSATGGLYDFYTALLKCYDALQGKASYSIRDAESDLVFDVNFDNGKVEVVGEFRENPIKKDILYFEFSSDQSYFKDVLNDLKKVVTMFGDNKGVRI